MEGPFQLLCYSADWRWDAYLPAESRRVGTVRCNAEIASTTRGKTELVREKSVKNSKITNKKNPPARGFHLISISEQVEENNRHEKSTECCKCNHFTSELIYSKICFVSTLPYRFTHNHKTILFFINPISKLSYYHSTGHSLNIGFRFPFTVKLPLPCRIKCFFYK